MASWLTSSQIVAGQKVYLLVGEAGPVHSVLTRVLDGVQHVYRCFCPIQVDDLGVDLGAPGDSMAIVIQNIQDASEEEWDLITKWLSQYKVPGRSLVLTGSAASNGPNARLARKKVSSQGVYLEAVSPTGEVGRRELVEWVAQEWKITVRDAQTACVRADYSLERLVWSTRIFQALSSGRVITGNLAQKLITLAVPVTDVDDIYRRLLTKSHSTTDAVSLSSQQALTLFRMLESALTDLSMISSTLVPGMSAKTVAGRTGIHIVRVLELLPLVPRYAHGVIQRCRQVLAVGFDYYRQPEVVNVVLRLWG